MDNSSIIKNFTGLWKTISNEMPQYMRWIDQQPDDRLNNEGTRLTESLVFLF